MSAAQRTRWLLDKTCMEIELQAAVVRLAKLCQWRVFHPYDSRRSEPGWPDLTLCRGTELLFVELKTASGRVRPEQAEWIDALKAAGAEVVVWRPAQWSSGEIERRLA